MLKAKPFPSQIRIGADVAHVPRFTELITSRLARQDGSERDEILINGRRPGSLEFWARRVLSRLEWPRFRVYLEALNLSRSASSNLEIQQLAQWLASRWAAKEAAIKAHSHRRLHMPHISIIKDKKSPRPIMLIDPPNSIVRFSAEVAEKREINTKIKQKLDATRLNKLGLHFADILDEYPRYWRYRRVKMEDRQVADVSISHDGEYAFAVVQALDEPVMGRGTPEIIEDSGEGKPIHEPQYGDRGFFDLTLKTKDGDEADGSTDAEISFQDYMFKAKR